MDKNTAIATVAGLLLGLGLIAFLGLGLAACGMPVSSTCAGTVFYSALGIICLGAFAIATSTERTAATVVATNMAAIFAMELAGYLLAWGKGEGSEAMGYAMAVYFLTVLPITLLAAWLGTRFGRWRSANSM